MHIKKKHKTKTKKGKEITKVNTVREVRLSPEIHLSVVFYFI